MQNIFTILCCLMLPIFSFKEKRPKLCIDCKYFINNGNSNRYGKCSLFPIHEINVNHLVTGVHVMDVNDYRYCSTARKMDHLCGNEGKLYKKQYKKQVDEQVDEHDC